MKAVSVNSEAAFFLCEGGSLRRSKAGGLSGLWH